MDLEQDHGDLIRLNVGGTFYMTTVETLVRESESFFAEIFTSDGLEQHKKVVRRFRNGVYFVDRDGELFAYILDYLRTGKLLLPESFRELARLREEVEFYKLEALMQQLLPYYNLKYPTRSPSVAAQQNGGNGGDKSSPTIGIAGIVNNIYETGGFITLGYRGTFAFGRDGQADIKFRKLHRILVCGKAQLCREVFGDTLNESRDPDREGTERYTARLYLKHQCFERACDNLAEKGFKLITSCSSGANGLASIAAIQPQTSGSPQMPYANFRCVPIIQKPSSSNNEFMNQRNSGDLEEQRWAHYTEYVFYREPQFNPFSSNSPAQSPRN